MRWYIRWTNYLLGTPSFARFVHLYPDTARDFFSSFIDLLVSVDPKVALVNTRVKLLLLA